MTCPRCGGQAIEIVWGLVPWGPLAERAERGEVWIAGCNVPPDPPKWHCHGCGFEF